jgi:DNA-binding response OmpR family regulator
MRLLLVEDSERLRRSLTRSLSRSGYAIDAVGDGREGLWLAESNPYDVIILDIMLPGLDGISLLHELRSKGNRTHILMLTAKDTVEDRVTGLQMGADDYLIKPFAFEELLARIQALCRRSYGQKESLVAIGSLQIDTGTKDVRCGNEPVGLSPREFRLLEYLAMRQGQTVSREAIEAHIYDDMVEPMSNVVDAAIYALRKKLARFADAPLIHTRRGFGYILEAREEP